VPVSGPAGGGQAPAATSAPATAEPPASTREPVQDTPRPPATRPPTQPPSSPTAPPPSPTARPSEPATVAPTEAPTALPTATPDKLPPRIDGISQDINIVSLGGVAAFRVRAVDPDGGPLSYEWTSTWGEMLNPQAEEATFHAIGNMSGIGLIVTITVRVTDQDGHWAEDHAYIDVIPRALGGSP
jgi:hypothetical protein